MLVQRTIKTIMRYIWIFLYYASIFRIGYNLSIKEIDHVIKKIEEDVKSLKKDDGSSISNEVKENYLPEDENFSVDDGEDIADINMRYEREREEEEKRAVSCTTSNHCPNSKPICFNNVCVECRSEVHCENNPSKKFHCDLETSKCFADEEEIDEEFCLRNPRHPRCSVPGSDIIELPEKRSAIRNRNWPGGIVPIQFDGTVSAESRTLIWRSINGIQQETCIRFINQTVETAYVFVTSEDSGCFSFLGRTGSRQQLNLQDNRGDPLRGTCMTRGIIQHEFLHALGFYHEQSRPDRDQFVKINFENIINRTKSNFEIAGNSDTQDLEYDFGSLMHYGPRAFSRNGQNTIIPRNGFENVPFGQRNGASELDLEGVRRLYDCPVATAATTTATTTTTTTTTTENPTTITTNKLTTITEEPTTTTIKTTKTTEEPTTTTEEPTTTTEEQTTTTKEPTTTTKEPTKTTEELTSTTEEPTTTTEEPTTATEEPTTTTEKPATITEEQTTTTKEPTTTTKEPTKATEEPTTTTEEPTTTTEEATTTTEELTTTTETPSGPQPIATLEEADSRPGRKIITLSFSPFADGTESKAGRHYFCARVRIETELPARVFSLFTVRFGAEGKRVRRVRSKKRQLFYLRRTNVQSNVKLLGIYELTFRFSLKRPINNTVKYKGWLFVKPFKRFPRRRKNAANLTAKVDVLSIFEDQRNSQYPCVPPLR